MDQLTVSQRNVHNAKLASYAHRPLAFLFRYIRRHPVAHTIVLVSVLAAVGCALASQYAIKHLIDVLGPLLDAGRIKLYSCDSAAGKALVTKEGSSRHRMWLQNQFHYYVRHEVAFTKSVFAKFDQEIIVRVAIPVIALRLISRLAIFAFH